MTSGDPKQYNLQIQINKQTRISTLKKLAPKTVSTVLAPVDPEMTAQQLRAALKENWNVPGSEPVSEEPARSFLVGPHMRAALSSLYPGIYRYPNWHFDSIHVPLT
jgi:hypothetical protein